MSRATRRVLVVVALLAIAVAVALVVTTRPNLDAARDDVDAAWEPLRAPLDQRYSRLAAAGDAVGRARSADSTVLDDLDAALARWRDSQADGGGPVTEQVRAANELEGVGRRLSVTVEASTRLSNDAAVTGALAAYTAALPDPGAVDTYGAAAATYENERTGRWRRVVADLLGYRSVPTLELDR